MTQGGVNLGNDSFVTANILFILLSVQEITFTLRLLSANAKDIPPDDGEGVVISIINV